jgi:hypothetical protein
MTNQHQITPPSELLEQWVNTAQKLEGPLAYTKSIALQAAQWGADQELEACCAEVAWLESSETAKRMRERRRPKPPTLKEQALEALREAESSGCLYVNGRSDTIRRALETLDD